MELSGSARKQVWMSPASSTAFFRSCSGPSLRARVRSQQPPRRATLFTGAQRRRLRYGFARSGSSMQVLITASHPSPQVRLRAIGLLCRSVGAANRFPGTIQVQNSLDFP